MVYKLLADVRYKRPTTATKSEARSPAEPATTLDEAPLAEVVVATPGSEVRAPEDAGALVVDPDAAGVVAAWEVDAWVVVRATAEVVAAAEVVPAAAPAPVMERLPTF